MYGHALAHGALHLIVCFVCVCAKRGEGKERMAILSPEAHTLGFRDVCWFNDWGIAIFNGLLLKRETVFMCVCVCVYVCVSA